MRTFLIICVFCFLFSALPFSIARQVHRDFYSTLIRKHAFLLLIISLMVAAVEHNGYYVPFPTVNKVPSTGNVTTSCVGGQYAACTIPIPPPGNGFPNRRGPICPCRH
ncbi:hypothetical protein Goshw_020084 [Gossypium schwendimanii]|uniref:Uncharacterized protein n=1 Tax=Gossypium schwendimanii TaxID=34291 RepID=A0A7J9KM87_GOSSC|nr:hypothetical protein [Gossypium schwendimanii]